MRLKAFTTGLVIFGFLMLLALPLVLQQNPDVRVKRLQTAAFEAGNKDAQLPTVTRRERAEYAALFGSYIMGMLVLWVIVIICAMIYMRQVRKEILEETQANMQAFIEGTLADHAKRYPKAEKGDDGGLDG